MRVVWLTVTSGARPSGSGVPAEQAVVTPVTDGPGARLPAPSFIRNVTVPVPEYHTAASGPPSPSKSAMAIPLNHSEYSRLSAKVPSPWPRSR
ncbi:MAG: hypothetical protein BWZ02_02644 [Lentisphaerae bacterium ADurb.BinA184]|nr:MAG: hypothetical protein BWZ02_02644 [Lentisphaerae bacterium ADurb.BinA184]